MLIQAGQIILDSGGTIRLDSSFASLTCWNEGNCPNTQNQRMFISGWCVMGGKEEFVTSSARKSYSLLNTFQRHHFLN